MLRHARVDALVVPKWTWHRIQKLHKMCSLLPCCILPCYQISNICSHASK